MKTFILTSTSLVCGGQLKPERERERGKWKAEAVRKGLVFRANLLNLCENHTGMFSSCGWLTLMAHTLTHTHLQWRVDTGRPDLRRCQGFLVCTSLGSHLALSFARSPSFVSLFFQIYIEKENRPVFPSVWQRSGKRKTDSEKEGEMSENIGMEISSGVDAVVKGGSPPCHRDFDHNGR